MITSDCPFSESCNHNCVFHIFAAVGLLPFIFAAVWIDEKDKAQIVREKTSEMVTADSQVVEV